MKNKTYGASKTLKGLPHVMTATECANNLAMLKYSKEYKALEKASEDMIKAFVDNILKNIRK